MFAQYGTRPEVFLKISRDDRARAGLFSIAGPAAARLRCTDGREYFTPAERVDRDLFRPVGIRPGELL